MPTMNATHRKRLARALAAHEGIAYMAALDKVTKAAVAGRLPTALDEAGMQAALRVLSTSDAETVAPWVPPEMPATPEDAPVRQMASDVRDQSLYDLSFEYEQITGLQGLLYVTSPDGKADKYVFGSGFVALGRKEALAHLETLVADARLLRGGGERYYLIPEALRLLRQVWQGRVTQRAKGWDRKQTRFAIDDKPASDINDLHLRWLHKHRYLEANLSPAEEWAVARTTEFGDEVLARNGADVDKFHDGLPTPGSPVTPAAFSTEGTVPATVRGLLKVREEFVKAGRVEWWWHTGDFAGLRGFKTVEDVTTDGSLILRDEDPHAIEPVTRLMLDYIDTPEDATRHLLWSVTDRTGVTLCDKTGRLDATWRIAPPAEMAATMTVTSKGEAQRMERTGKWIAEAFSDDDDAITLHRVRNLVANPDDDRLMGGPYTTKVYDKRNRQVNATCDLCNRRLTTGEPWWMVHSPDRNWENNAGVVCGLHHPDLLPPHTTESISTQTAPRTRAKAAQEEQRILDLLGLQGGRLHVAGIVDCLTVLALVEKGKVAIESGTITASGGSGVIVLTSTASSDSGAETSGAVAANKVHKARPNDDATHCAVCMQPVKQVLGGQGRTWIHAETGRVAASGPDPQAPSGQH